MNKSNDFQIIKIFDYVLQNAPKEFNVTLEINNNGNYQINFIKETK